VTLHEDEIEIEIDLPLVRALVGPRPSRLPGGEREERV